MSCFDWSVVSLPARVVDNWQLAERWADDLVQRKLAAEQLTRAGGVSERRVLEEDCPIYEQSARAVQVASELGCEIQSVARLIHFSTTPQAVSPATAHFVHGALGLPGHVPAADVSSSCSSFMSSLGLGGSQSLIVGSEAKSRHLAPEDRRTVSLFGDAAFACRTNQRCADLEWLQPLVKANLVNNIGVRREGNRDVLRIREGRLMYRETVQAFVHMISRAFARAHDLGGELRRVYLHQPNANLLADVKSRLPESQRSKIPVLLSDLGNLVSCSMPIHRVRCRLLEGMLEACVQHGPHSVKEFLNPAVRKRVLLHFLMHPPAGWRACVTDSGTLLAVERDGETLAISDRHSQRFEDAWLFRIAPLEWSQFLLDWDAECMQRKKASAAPPVRTFDALIVAGGGFQCLGVLQQSERTGF